MSVLEKICADKRVHVDAKMRLTDLKTLKVKSQESDTPRGFINAIQSKKQSDVAVITEVKKASPSKGIIRAVFNPIEIAKTYEASGAACLSVLTDEPYFQGHDDYFTAIRDEVSLPMLRKDFMIDPYQIYESRVMGADCILLIMACLSDDLAEELYALTTALGMDALFEVHDEEELSRSIALKPKMIGVNNRNLKTLEVDLATGMALAKNIPDTVLKIAESGIYEHAHIETFLDAGYDAFLVGESLMKQDDIHSAYKALTVKS